MPWQCGSKSVLTTAQAALAIGSSCLAAGPDYTVDSRGVHIAGVDGTNPVVFDNDWFTDICDSDYSWVQAGLRDNLRGIIVTRDFWGCGTPSGCKYDIKEQMTQCMESVNYARSSGITNIPEPVFGAAEMMTRPPGGAIDETAFTPTAGSNLIVELARKASPQRPLVIFAGGPVTTIATAYMQDKEAVSRNVVVFALSLGPGDSYNGKDSWAPYIVAKRCRMVFWWFFNNYSPDLSRLANLPNDPISNQVRDYWNRGHGGGRTPGQGNKWGDGPHSFWFYRNSIWTNAQRVNITNAFEYEVTLDETFDALLIRPEHMDLAAIEDEFFSVMEKRPGSPARPGAAGGRTTTQPVITPVAQP